ncbi:MAG TPA: type II toxin-antitoxin system prevent-host-death family antitoxin [Gaiellaceae bacterium]|nr:type II toxin-antitoxin system prevent-host-death family antitoxin [Gaiellaceae bacterium]
MEVGVRELRADLSRWLHRVRDGEEVVVTDRGKAVARILPVNGERRIDRLIREGTVTPAPRPWRGKLPKPIEDAGPLSDIVLGDRR